MPVSIYVDLDKTGNWFAFRSPFNREFVEEFKAKVPARHRRWEAEARAWCVTRPHWNTTEGLLRKHYGGLNGTDLKFDVGPAAEAAHIEMMTDEVQAPDAQDSALLGLRIDVPIPILHAAYVAIELAWQTVDADVLQSLGIFPLEESRAAYKRVCAQRGVQPAPPKAVEAALAAFSKATYGQEGGSW